MCEFEHLWTFYHERVCEQIRKRIYKQTCEQYFRIFCSYNCVKKNFNRIQAQAQVTHYRTLLFCEYDSNSSLNHTYYQVPIFFQPSSSKKTKKKNSNCAPKILNEANSGLRMFGSLTPLSMSFFSVNKSKFTKLYFNYQRFSICLTKIYPNAYKIPCFNKLFRNKLKIIKNQNTIL